MRRLIAALAWCLVAPAGMLFAGEFVDLPYGWAAVGTQTSDSASFADSSHTAVFQVRDYPADAFSSATQMFDAVAGRMSATGDHGHFTFSGRDAVFGDLTFVTAGIDVRGYAVFIHDASRNTLLLAYVPLEFYDEFHDELLSCVDSYSPDTAGRELPGAVSQFYYPFPAPKPVPTSVTIAGRQYRIGIDPKEIEAAQTIIDRETRILAESKQVNITAWKRYYRMLYRDNYHRLDAFMGILSDSLDLADKSAGDKATSILSWMQGFDYGRTGTFADLSNPLQTATSETGDCDSRTLLYAIILNHLKIRSLLLVSAVYSHSVDGVDIAGPGARYDYNGTSYLIAELTAKVRIGLVDKSMADSSGWIPIDLAGG
ncbi:MAG TPA: hypothetical protein VMV68_03415 [Spirochaetia bacterium]|nr:hypothetical protein [Spirochaetia bacterium]